MSQFMRFRYLSSIEDSDEPAPMGSLGRAFAARSHAQSKGVDESSGQNWGICTHLLAVHERFRNVLHRMGDMLQNIMRYIVKGARLVNISVAMLTPALHRTCKQDGLRQPVYNILGQFLGPKSTKLPSS